MATDSSELLYAGNGEIFVGPLATPMPATFDEALNAAFDALGFTTEDAVSIQPSMETNERRAWQSRLPIDERVVSKGLLVNFGLLQLNGPTFELNFGGGSWTLDVATHVYTPPAAEYIHHRAMVVEWLDGADVYRWLFPKTLVSSPGSLGPQAAVSAEMVMGVSVLETGTADLFNVLSNSDRFASA